MDEKTLIENFRLDLVALIGKYLAQADDLQGDGKTNHSLRGRLKSAFGATVHYIRWRTGE